MLFVVRIKYLNFPLQLLIQKSSNNYNEYKDKMFTEGDFIGFITHKNRYTSLTFQRIPPIIPRFRSDYPGYLEIAPKLPQACKPDYFCNKTHRVNSSIN